MLNSKISFQILLLVQSIVIGFTVFLVTKHRVHGIGHVGMELQQNSIVSEDFYTMKIHMRAIGHKTWEGAKNIVNNI